MNVKANKEQGMSLIEVLVTIFVLAVVCITLISVFVYGFNLLAKTKQTALATQVAQFEIERYRNMDFAAITTPSPSTQTFASLKSSYPVEYGFMFSAAGDAYLKNGQETITVQDGSTIGMDTQIKKMTVTVVWDYRSRTIASGSPMRKDFVTYFSKDGINRR